MTTPLLGSLKIRSCFIQAAITSELIVDSNKLIVKSVAPIIAPIAFYLPFAPQSWLP
jgi:hypothetical protein